eukprot:scaffold2482_cov116-Cylindrotheca_fusiformis.AAC.8
MVPTPTMRRAYFGNTRSKNDPSKAVSTICSLMRNNLRDLSSTERFFVGHIKIRLPSTVR